jgi:hypothetical protein
MQYVCIIYNSKYQYCNCVFWCVVTKTVYTLIQITLMMFQCNSYFTRTLNKI